MVSSKWLNNSIWLIDESLTPRQNGPGSNGKERVLHILQKLQN